MSEIVTGVNRKNKNLQSGGSIYYVKRKALLPLRQTSTHSRVRQSSLPNQRFVMDNSVPSSKVMTNSSSLVFLTTERTFFPVSDLNTRFSFVPAMPSSFGVLLAKNYACQPLCLTTTYHAHSYSVKCCKLNCKQNVATQKENWAFRPEHLCIGKKLYWSFRNYFLKTKNLYPTKFHTMDATVAESPLS